MLYIMRRTQLYLDDQLWNVLHARAKSENTTISELVRQAVRQHFVNPNEEQREAMQAFVASRPPRRADKSAVEQVRALRRGTRLDRFTR